MREAGVPLLADPAVIEEERIERRAGNPEALERCTTADCHPVNDERVLRAAGEALRMYNEKMKRGSLTAQEARIAERICRMYGKRLGRQEFCAKVE